MYGFQPKHARGKAVPKLADGGPVPFGSRGVAGVRELIPKMAAMGFQPQTASPPPDASNNARLRAMIPQMEAMGYKQQPQYLADGGMVHSIKGMLGLRPKTREELLAADAKAQERNREAAAKVAERTAQQPAPATPAPQSAITDYAGMSAMQRREKEQGLKNGGMVKPHGFKAGGLIRGPGTGTSDSIETEKRPGTFIMPADSTQAIGPEALEELGEPEEMGEEAESMEGQGGEAGEAVPVRLSNGEFEFPPEQVQALGEAVLTVMRDATHEQAKGGPKGMPKAAGFAPRQFFADGGPVETDVTRVGNSYSGGNVGGSVSINGQAGSGTMSTVPAPVVPAPTTAAAPVAAAAPTATPAAHAAPAAPAATTATPAAAPAAPMGWAERNAQRSNQVTASSIMDSPERRAAQAALAPAPVAAPAPAIGLDATKPKPFGVQPPAFGTPAGFQPRGYANGGTVQDEEKQRLANQTAMYVQGAQAQAASRPATAVAPPAPAAPPPATPKAAGFMPGTRAVFNESGKAIGDLASQGRYGAAAGETARAALAYVPAVADDVLGGAWRAVAPTVADTGKQFLGVGDTAPAPSAPPAMQSTTAATTKPPMAPVPAQPAASPAAPSMDTSAAPASQPLGSGAVSAQNDAAAQGVATRSAAGFVPGGSGSMQVAAPVVRNSTNDWAARKQLDNLATGASSITNTSAWSRGTTTNWRGQQVGGQADQDGKVAAYQAALKNDLALQQAQPGMDQAAMRENGDNQRTAVQDAGATERTVIQDQGATNSEAGRTALAQGEQEMRRTAAGFQTRAAAQLENLRNVLLDPKATPEQRKIAQRSLESLNGKTAADRMQVVNLPDTVTDQGVVAKGGQALIRTLEDGTVERVPIAGTQEQGAQRAAPKVGAVEGGYKFKGGDPANPASWQKV